jgi:hypothetical protein
MLLLEDPMRKAVFLLVFVATAVLLAKPALAQYPTVASGNPWGLNATFMPSMIQFHLSVAVGTASQCAAGQAVAYIPQGPDAPTQLENAKAVYALLMVAEITGKQVGVYAASSTPGPNGWCALQGIWLQPPN